MRQLVSFYSFGNVRRRRTHPRLPIGHATASASAHICARIPDHTRQHSHFLQELRRRPPQETNCILAVREKRITGHKADAPAHARRHRRADQQPRRTSPLGGYGKNCGEPRKRRGDGVR